ncbi:MAG: hypothetical protein RR915_05485 [Cellulosilyticaceae bacterium]
MNKKTNKDKFKELAGKKKIEYIWDYYRWHIVGVILGILAIWQVVVIINKPPMPVYTTDIVVSGGISMDEEIIDQTLEKYNTEFDANIQFMPVNWNSMDQSTMATEQLLALKMMVREVDLMILGEAKFEKYQLVENSDALMALDRIPELEEVLKQYEDKLLTFTSKEDGKEHVFGIKVDKLDKIEGVVMGEELVLCLVNPPKNVEPAIDMVKYILE